MSQTRQSGTQPSRLSYLIHTFNQHIAFNSISSQMGYDLVVLPKDWFFEDLHPGKFDFLTNIINTAYDKPKEKYGIIKTHRIKKAQNLPQELQYSKEKDVFLALLLGLKDGFSGFDTPRDFSKTPFLSKDYTSHFGEISTDNVNVIHVDSTFPVTKDIEDRVLATVGFKTYNGSSKTASTVEFEMTAFTSFLLGIAPKLLEFVIENTFKDPKTSLFDADEVSTVHLHAVVIRDHELVPYYAKYCGFHRFDQPDVVITSSSTDSPLEDGIQASRDFYLAFLRRTIQLSTN